MPRNLLDRNRISLLLLTFGLIIALVFFQFFVPSKSNAVTSCTSGSFSEVINGNTRILTFLNDHSHDSSCQFQVPANVYSLDYLIVAGGGGGNSGGGGAGGVVTSWEVKNQSGTSTLSERNIPLGVSPGDVLNVSVGIGGQGGSGGNYNTWGIVDTQMPLGTSGRPSVLGGITAYGGGRGGYGFGCAGGAVGCDQTGASGGSNGGAAYDNTSTNNNLVSGTTYVGATSLGNIGGAASGEGGYRAGSGGGGAGSPGVSADVLHIGGAGGAGINSDISGSSTTYACGGGGGINENDTSFQAEFGYINQSTNVFISEESFYGLFFEAYSDEEYTYYTDSTDSELIWKYSYAESNYISPSNEIWSWGALGRESYYSSVSGGGAGGCAQAGRGSNIGVYGPWGVSTLSNATSGENNFGHGGGGTDPESTVAGDGGSGVVIIRYVMPDSHCPNDHEDTDVITPVACTAAITISADGNIESIFVNGAPISYTAPANSPVVSILSAPVGLSTFTNGESISVSAPVNSSLAGGTYAIRYRITEGAESSDSVLLVTVRDPNQHSPILVLVDPRATQVKLPTLVIGNVNATLVCITPSAGDPYNHPIVNTSYNLPNISKDLFSSTGGIRLIDTTTNPESNSEMQSQVEFLVISKSPLDSLLIPGNSSRFLNINVSNTATGGNGSCTGGTSSTVEIRPIGIDQTLRKGPVNLKN